MAEEEEEEEEARAVRGRKGSIYLSYPILSYPILHIVQFVGWENLGNIHASSGRMALMLGRLPPK